MYFAAKDVQALDNYLLCLTFSNGEKRIFDMKPYLETGIFRELKDVAIFKTVKISFDKVEWENEADIDPETLYDESRIMSLETNPCYNKPEQRTNC